MGPKGVGSRGGPQKGGGGLQGREVPGEVGLKWVTLREGGGKVVGMLKALGCAGGWGGQKGNRERERDERKTGGAQRHQRILQAPLSSECT